MQESKKNNPSRPFFPPLYSPKKKKSSGFLLPPQKKTSKKKLGFQETSKDSSLGCHASLALKKVVRRGTTCVFPILPAWTPLGCCDVRLFGRLSFCKTVWSLFGGVLCKLVGGWRRFSSFFQVWNCSMVRNGPVRKSILELVRCFFRSMIFGFGIQELLPQLQKKNENVHHAVSTVRWKLWKIKWLLSLSSKRNHAMLGYWKNQKEKNTTSSSPPHLPVF